MVVHGDAHVPPGVDEVAGQADVLLAGRRIEAGLGDVVPVERVLGAFGDVLRRASELAHPGDAVLLSPACSSYDMFRDYEDRGTQFRRLVLEGIA